MFVMVKLLCRICSSYYHLMKSLMASKPYMLVVDSDYPSRYVFNIPKLIDLSVPIIVCG
jgi:hypothetical protein